MCMYNHILTTCTFEYVTQNMHCESMNYEATWFIKHLKNTLTMLSCTLTLTVMPIQTLLKVWIGKTATKKKLCYRIIFTNFRHV